MEFRYDFDDHRKEQKRIDKMMENPTEALRKNMQPMKQKKNLLLIIAFAVLVCLGYIAINSMQETAARISLEEATNEVVTIQDYTDTEWISEASGEIEKTEAVEETTEAAEAATEEMVTTENTKATTKNTETESTSNAEAETSDISETELETTEETAVTTLDYTSNSIPDLSSCLKVKSFATAQAPDGSFSFVYPKYMFNTCEVLSNGSNGYQLSYIGESSEPYSLTVYSKEHSGDALKHAKSIYRKYKKQADESEKIIAPTYSEETGIARAVLVTSTGDHSNYIVIASDGAKDYVMSYSYESPEYADYIIECLYRGCSFSGSTKELRSYKQYKK